MGMYYCFQCDNHKDNDHEHCEPHPYDKKAQFVCPQCADELRGEAKECLLEDQQERLNDE